MLQIITSPAKLDFGQIMQVYQQSIQISGKENYPHMDENPQILEAEQDFYLYLKTFLRERENVCAVWLLEGKYVSALRVEPYRDGVLIAGLETAPAFRGKGCAKELLSATLGYLKEKQCNKIYSHIHKDNVPSIRTHLACGFVRVADHCVYIDGSADSKSYTYIYEN